MAGGADTWVTAHIPIAGLDGDIATVEIAVSVDIEADPNRLVGIESGQSSDLAGTPHQRTIWCAGGLPPTHPAGGRWRGFRAGDVDGAAGDVDHPGRQCLRDGGRVDTEQPGVAHRGGDGAREAGPQRRQSVVGIEQHR